MKYISGEILTEKQTFKGYLCFKDNKIVEIGKGRAPKKSLAKGLIIPSFVNSHTHIGDSFIKNKKITMPKNIKDLVAPPDGLKHRLLKEATSDEIIKGMRKTIEFMLSNSVGLFCDFREGGIKGINQLKTAVNQYSLSAFILSRPEKLEYNKKEIDLLLENSQGIGLSSISDWDYSEIFKIAKHTKNKKKIFAVHASELIREDINKILDLKPDFLVHMIKASEDDLILVRENKIPVVICPRSNDFFNLKVNYNLLKKTGVEIILGTDNAMLNNPSILEEIFFVKQKTNLFSLHDLIYNCTYTARKVLNQECDILCSNSKAGFVVLDKKTFKPLYILNREEGLM
jgi:cytosine/adenosine deaminase-related metal-dependent hydrolase